MAKKTSSPELLKALAGMDKAYTSGSKTWFSYLSDDVLVYSSSSGEPFKGKAAYAKHFEKSLTSATRKVKILNREIQTMGEISVVYQAVQILQENVIINMKQSQVWKLTDKGWKVNHIHSAVVGSPQALKPETSRASTINVINEKIASMAAVLGVAQ